VRNQAPTPAELLEQANRTACRLEMRDGYMRSDPWFRAWQQGEGEEYEKRTARPWLDLIQRITSRGVRVRRVRIISEPVSDYIRFEYATTSGNITAGERIRWLPRRRASGLALPGNDYWIIDGTTVLFSHYTGDGEVSPSGRELTTDPAVAGLCASAFDSAWALGIEHRDYQV
jgi:hypothetical protein